MFDSPLIDPFLIEEGEVHAFRIFDIGSEINLAQAAQILEKQKTLHPFGLKKPTRLVLIAERPLVISLESWQEEIDHRVYEIQATAKLWSFGAVSIQLSLALSSAHTIEKLCEVGYFFENNIAFHKRVTDQAKQLLVLLTPAIDMPGLWSQYEEYLVYNIKKAAGLNNDLKQAFTGDKTTSLILGERIKKFSSQIHQSLDSSMYQYTSQDLVLLHWNGALIFDLEDAPDIILTLEYVLCCLLELRYYDEKLDEQLKNLYYRITHRPPSLFYNSYKNLSEQAALQYIEISEIVDRIGNAFKVLGDFYYATIYRAATQKFYLGDWKKSVDEKLNNLAEVSLLFQGEVNERRNQFMEIIIIILIAVEVIPLIQHFFH
jgi:hypothetical protein